MDSARDDGGERQIEGACPNCGDPRPGNYCPNCGQRRTERRVTLRRMLAEAVEDQLSLNAALPRTLFALFFRPGFLSSEYMAGRIQRYVPPFRLYLVSSLVFFLVLSFVTRIDEDRFINVTATGADSAAVAGDSTGARADTLAGRRLVIGRDTLDLDTIARGDTAVINELLRSDRLQENWLKNVRIQTHVALLDSAVNRKIREFDRIGPRESLRQVLDEVVRRAPTAMFLLLPVFAALLKLLYLRRNRFYVEHFVFGLHTHAFSFLVLTVLLLFTGNLEGLLLLWMLVYYFAAMKRFYRQGWIRTLLKAGVLAWSYLFIFGLVLTGTLIVAVLLV